MIPPTTRSVSSVWMARIPGNGVPAARRVNGLPVGEAAEAVGMMTTADQVGRLFRLSRHTVREGLSALLSIGHFPGHLLPGLGVEYPPLF